MNRCLLLWRSVRVPPVTSRIAITALALLCALANSAFAEQKVKIGAFEVHYVVFPSTFLNADVASTYGIVRARDLSVLNLSVLDPQGKGAKVDLVGQAKNLLGQLSPLQFREVREGDALYYLAEVRHANREVLRFSIAITAAAEQPFNLDFQQELFWGE